MQSSNLIGGRYRLARRVGAGNMGVVFEVEDQQTGRRVALKQVLYGAKENQQRLLREARVCQRLKHPNIIEVLDVGVTEAGVPFLVMPLLTGETIADLLKRKRRVAPMLAAQVGRDIASALAAAHAEGIIHRDLKPANVFIHRPRKAEKPIIKVLDFGVCKDVNSRLTVLTSAGNVVGTPAYMSPEQLKGAELDARTDVWSLGVVLFEMLTGVRPFRGEGVELFLKILNGEIPTVSRLVRSMPVGLADVVARCLARDREQRIGSAAELASQLDDLLRDGMVASAAPSTLEQSTSSGMATHLGSQTVDGAVLVEAAASGAGAGTLESATSAPAYGPPPSTGIPSETLRSAPLPGSEDRNGRANGAEGARAEVADHRAMTEGSAAKGGSDGASAGMTFRSLIDEDEASLAAGQEHTGGMALDGEVLEGMPRGAVLVMISAAALMCALLGVGIYAAATEASKQTAMQAVGLSEGPIPPLSLVPDEKKEEPAASAGALGGSPASAEAVSEASEKSPQPTPPPTKPPRSQVKAAITPRLAATSQREQGASRASRAPQAPRAPATVPAQPTSSSLAMSPPFSPSQAKASPPFPASQAKASPPQKGPAGGKPPGTSAAKSCSGAGAKQCNAPRR